MLGLLANSRYRTFFRTIPLLSIFVTALLISSLTTPASSATVARDADSTFLRVCPGDPASVSLRLSDFLAARPDLAHFPNFRVASHAITFFYRLCSDKSFLSATFGTVLINDVFQPESPRDPSLASPMLSASSFILDRRRKYPDRFMSVKHASKSSVVLVNNVVQSLHIHSLPDQNAQGYFIASRTGVHDVFVDTRALSDTCVSSDPSSCQPGAVRRIQSLHSLGESSSLASSFNIPTEARRETSPQLDKNNVVGRQKKCVSQSLACATNQAQRVLKVTLVADQFYCANVSLTSSKFKLNDGAPIFANMKSTFDKIAEIFVDQTCILLDAVNFVAFCNPKTSPFTPAFYGPQLRTNFASWWQQKYKSATHAKILLTGSGLSKGGFAGSAGRGTVCQPENSFAWAIGCNALVVAHELGHIVGAFHDIADTTSLMSEFTTKDTEPRFSANSLNEIFNEVDCQSTKCMKVVTPTPSPAPLVCSGTTSDTQQFGCTWFTTLGAIDASAGKIVISSSQSHGQIVLQGTTSDSRTNKRRVAFLAAIITPSSAYINPETIMLAGQQKTFGSFGYFKGKLSYPAEDIVISPFYTTCCNQDLFVHMKVGLYSTITNNGVPSRKLFNATRTFKVRVSCNNPCAADPGGRSVAAKYPLIKCPACVPTSYTPMSRSHLALGKQ